MYKYQAEAHALSDYSGHNRLFMCSPIAESLNHHLICPNQFIAKYIQLKHAWNFIFVVQLKFPVIMNVHYGDLTVTSLA